MKMMVTGDVHGDFGELNALVNKKRPELVLCCGDFGYWPREPKYVYRTWQYGYQIEKKKDRPVPKIPEGCLVFWCDGNHEDHQELGLRTTDELWPRVHYMPRGSLLDLPDGRRVMFFGGAMSMDRGTRMLGKDWFPEESISDADIRSLSYEGEVDMVVSHTCPREFDIGVVGKDEGYYRDCSRTALSWVLHHYRPKRWYFGHWHHYIEGEYLGCRWTGFDHTFGGGRWWDWMD